MELSSLHPPSRGDKKDGSDLQMDEIKEPVARHPLKEESTTTWTLMSNLVVIHRVSGVVPIKGVVESPSL
jgi:hypothetical protein